jgi:hypothetical protein
MELHRHHVLPLASGGPDVAANLVWLCPTAHANAHELLRLIVKRQGWLTFTEVVELYPERVNRYVWSVARDGWARMVAR